MGKRKVLDPTYCEKSRNKFVWWERTRGSCSQDKRVMPTKGEEKLSFKVGDYMYLNVSPMRGLRHFKVQGMLAPRFIGPFKILENKGEVAYQLELPPQLSDVHGVFHISQLKKCLCVPKERMPMEDLDA
jgi:hypothetical protein